MDFAEYKKNVERYLLYSVDQKKCDRLIELFKEELIGFFNKKLDVSTAGTLMLQGY